MKQPSEQKLNRFIDLMALEFTSEELAWLADQRFTIIDCCSAASLRASEKERKSKK